MCMKTRSIWRSPNISSHLKMFMQASLQSILRWKPTHEQAGENYFVISLYKSEKICIIICSLPFLKRQTSWRRSEAAVTRRTRNAFIGSSRYEGSNPSVSAPEPLVFKGSFVFAAQGRLSGNWRLLSWTKFCHKVLEVWQRKCKKFLIKKEENCSILVKT